MRILIGVLASALLLAQQALPPSPPEDAIFRSDTRIVVCHTTVIDKTGHLITNLPKEGFADDEDRERFSPARLYEQFYCARGEMENVLKQQVLDLQGDRMSTHHMASNQLRLWFSTFAYMLMERVRTLGCQGTELARATSGTLRLKLMKVAAQVKVSVRRVYIQLSSAFPLQKLFRLCQQRLSALAEPTG